MFLAAANDFLILVLALETLSLSSYVLAGYLRADRESSEASIKYVLYGAVASSVMIFGFSYLYGMSGTMKLAGAFAPLAAGGNNIAFTIAFAMILAGIGFKISAVPFHNWTPDVYQGSPTPVTAFLAVVSKSAGFAILIRLVMQAGASAGGIEWAAVGERLFGGGFHLLFWILAAATMTVGNFVALRQTNIKRLLGYSSIAHAGYLLMMFTVLNEQAMEAALFYFVVYYVMTLGAFYVAIVLENRAGGCDLKDCRGMSAASPWLVVTMVVFLVSLTGLPPMVGFTGKLKLFKAVVDAGLSEAALSGAWFYFSLALIGVINSVVSLYYYFKIVKAMALEKCEQAPDVRLGVADKAITGVLAAAVIVLFLYVGPAIEFAQSAFAGLSSSVVAGGM
jgi:NADH-quinone oxidoreductase subunit N